MTDRKKCSPFIRISPESFGIKPAKILKRVVFPLAEGPVNPKNSPFLISKFKLEKIGFSSPGKVFLIG